MVACVIGWPVSHVGLYDRVAYVTTIDDEKDANNEEAVRGCRGCPVTHRTLLTCQTTCVRKTFPSVSPVSAKTCTPSGRVPSNLPASMSRQRAATHWQAKLHYQIIVGKYDGLTRKSGQEG